MTAAQTHDARQSSETLEKEDATPKGVGPVERQNASCTDRATAVVLLGEGAILEVITGLADKYAMAYGRLRPLSTDVKGQRPITMDKRRSDS